MNAYKTLYAETLHSVFAEDLELETIVKMIEKPKQEEHGDLAFPCFALARVWKKAPQQIAASVVDRLKGTAFTNFEANGPYINAFINRRAASKDLLNGILKDGADYGNHTVGHNEVITIDLSSPNIAKPFSMGHIRSTVIGNSIANLAEKCGYQTVRINYIGDWGTQFGKLIAAYKKWGDEAAVRAEPIAELFKLYTHFHVEAETDPSLNDEGRLWFKKLENGNSEALELWHWFRDVSIEAFNEVYSLLGVHFDSMNGEAFYNDKMDAVVDELQEKGLLEESKGALVVHLDEDELPPCLIKKKDGTTLYATRDLASALYRKKEYHFSKSFYVVGNEQSLHFTQVKKVLGKMGYDWAQDMEHIPFGMILKDGKKMSTRKGKVELFENVLADIIDRARASISEKNPTLTDKETVAKQVGVGAVIFNDLKHFRMNDVEFSLEDMLKFEGNTGPYLQYTYARARSILRKAGKTPQTIADGLEDNESWAVMARLGAFPNDVLAAFNEQDPSIIARSLFRIAQSFNHYYAHSRILDSENLDEKLALTETCTIVIKEGLRLLGLEAPEEM